MKDVYDLCFNMGKEFLLKGDKKVEELFFFV